MNLSIPFIISEGPRPFKFFRQDGRSDPLDVNTLVHGWDFRLDVESERPECLEIEIDPVSPLEIYDPNRPAGKLIPLSPGGPFRVSATLYGKTGEAIAAGGFLAYVVNDAVDVPQGDLAIALGPGETPVAAVPTSLIIQP